MVGGLTATNGHKVVAFCDTDGNKIKECFYCWGLSDTVQAGILILLPFVIYLKLNLGGGEVGVKGGSTRDNLKLLHQQEVGTAFTSVTDLWQLSSLGSDTTP